MIARTTGALDVDALVFDAYGTLFDTASVEATAERLFPGCGRELSTRWRAKQLEYSWLQSLMQTPQRRREDFAAITAHALDYALEWSKLTPAAAARRRLLDAYLELAPFADAESTLRALAPRPRIILSNGTQAMLEPLVAHAGLDAHIDLILSVDAVGVYKPSPRVYQLAVDRLRLTPARIGFVSANGWDAAGAKAFGLTAIWINRGAAPVERHAPAPDAIVDRLAALPSLL
jgi:2-haloacid dehalogenase